MVNKERFDKKYQKAGGLYQLGIMRSQHLSLLEISKHFGVTRERVRQWMVEIFGEVYDPRESRRDLLVNNISESLKKLGIEETKKIYKNKKFLELAILKSKKKHDRKR